MNESSLSSILLFTAIQQLALSRWHLLNCFRILILNASPITSKNVLKAKEERKKKQKNVHIIDCSRERKSLRNYQFGRIRCI